MTFILADALTIIMQIAGAALIGSAYQAISDGTDFSLVSEHLCPRRPRGLC